MKNPELTKSSTPLRSRQGSYLNPKASLRHRLFLFAAVLSLGPLLSAQPVLTEDFEAGFDTAKWVFSGNYTAIVEDQPHQGTKTVLLKGADHNGGASYLLNRTPLILDDALIEFWFRDLQTQPPTGGSPGFLAVYLTGPNQSWLGTFYQFYNQDLHYRRPDGTPNGTSIYGNLRINDGALTGWHKLGIRYTAGSQSQVRVYLDNVEVLEVALDNNGPLHGFQIACNGQYTSLGEAYIDDIAVSDMSTSPNTPTGKIVFSARPNLNDQWDVFAMNPDGTGVVNLTSDFDGPAWSPRISPDGQRIAFGSNLGGNGIWVMNADGTGKTKLAVAAEPYGPGLGNWLGNNTLIYYSGPASSTGRLRAVDLDGSNNRVLVNNPLFGNNDVGMDPRYSSAANQVVFLAQVGSWSPTYDLYLANPDGSNPQVFFADPGDNTMDRNPIWSRDGQTIFWSRPLGTGVNHNFGIVRRALNSNLPSSQFDAWVWPYAGVVAVPQATSPDDRSLLVSLGDGRLVLLDLDLGTFETLVSMHSMSGADWGYLVGDNTPPVVVCPMSTVVDCAGNEGEWVGISARVTDPDTGTLTVTLRDGSTGLASLTLASPVADGLAEFAPLLLTPGMHSMAIEVSDGIATDSCTFEVTILRDTEPPAITAPPAVVVNTDPGVCGASGVVLGTPVTFDNCGVASVANDAPAVFPKGETLVTWTVTDTAGNQSMAAQTVTVMDNEPPTFLAPAAVLVVSDAGSCVATEVALGWPVTSDNCGVAGVDNDAPTAFPLGETVVTWTVRDTSGNQSTATQTVTVLKSVTASFLPPLAGQPVGNNIRRGQVVPHGAFLNQ